MKGFFTYKILFSRNELSEAQLWNFISKESHVPFLRYSVFFSNYPMDLEICGVPIISISTNKHLSISTWEVKYFGIYLLNHKSFGHKRGQIKSRNIFRKDFERYGRLGLSARPFLTYQSAPVTQQSIMMSLNIFALLKVVYRDI